MAPPAWRVMEAAPPPVRETVPVPATVSAPVLRSWMEPPALPEVMVPLLVNIFPLIFMVMLLLEARVTLALTFVPTEVVVVTGPPLRLRVVVPAPADLAKVRDCPAVGVMAIEPPVVETVAEPGAPSGAVIVRGLAPPPESMVIAEAPEAEMEEPAPSVREGELIVRAAPDEIVSVVLAAVVIDEPVG